MLREISEIVNGSIYPVNWQTPAKKESGGVRVAPADLNGDGKADRVAKGDVNGDGKADVAAPTTEKRQHKPPVTFEKEIGASSPSAAPTTEKRQHSPVTFQKEVGPASPAK